MTKCDFCTKSGPEGKCSWSRQAFREEDCEKAIKLMIRAFVRKNGEKREFQEGGTDEAGN